MDFLKNKYWLYAGGTALAISLAIGAYFYFNFTSQVKGAATNSQAQAEVKKLVAEVGKLIDLPVGEDPTVATVTDVSKLKDQPFFQKAKNGDKVLIYTNSRKAILYDPKVKKVIDIAPLNIGSPSAQVTEPKIVLRNGTSTLGLTTKVETELKKTMPQINILDKENAQKQDFDKTIIIILNSSAQELAQSLVNNLKGSSIGDMPTGETKPKDGDILIILGKDRT